MLATFIALVKVYHVVNMTLVSFIISNRRTVLYKSTITFSFHIFYETMFKKGLFIEITKKLLLACMENLHKSRIILLKLDFKRSGSHA